LRKRHCDGLPGPSLAVHLGAILAPFVTMPHGKFIHGIYRFGALVEASA
jgi:citrate/tricarballylate utilization protein